MHSFLFLLKARGARVALIFAKGAQRACAPMLPFLLKARGARVALIFAKGALARVALRHF